MDDHKDYMQGSPHQRTGNSHSYNRHISYDEDYKNIDLDKISSEQIDFNAESDEYEVEPI